LRRGRADASAEQEKRESDIVQRSRKREERTGSGFL
jgi:hypothetical protein